MPEITDSELRQFVHYQQLGTPGEVQKKISDLESDNGKQRDEIRDLRAKVPKDDQVVVSKEEAEVLPKYKELGKPEEIKSKIETGEKAQGRLTEVETKLAAAKFAKAAGIHEDAVDTLVTLPVLSGATFEVRKSKVKDEKTGKEVEAEVGYLKLPGDDQKAMSFKDALEKVPALKGLRMADSTPPKQERTFVRQGGGENNSDTSLYDRIRQERDAANKPKEDAPKTKSIEERLGIKPAVTQ